MNDKINVTLLQPAKVDGKRRKVGVAVAVTQTVLAQLIAAGAVSSDAAAAAVLPATPLASDFDQALAAAIAERDAHWSTAMDHFETMAEDEKVALLTRIDELQTKLTAEGEVVAKNQGELIAAGEKIADLESHISDLESQIVVLKMPATPQGDQETANKPPAKKSAKEVRS